MIAYLSGEVVRKLPHGIVLLSGSGVGHEVFLLLPALAETRLGSQASFWIYTRQREDATHLYGFKSWPERELFELFLQVNGLGPRLVMALLSTLPIRVIQAGLHSGDPAVFQRVGGIGRRTAEKLIVELKSKLDRVQLILEESGEAVTLQGSLESHQQGLFSEEVEGQVPDLERQRLLLDLKSALLNLGFKAKEVSRTTEKMLERHPKEKDFSKLVKSALSELTGQVASPAKSGSPAVAEELF